MTGVGTSSLLPSSEEPESERSLVFRFDFESRDLESRSLDSLFSRLPLLLLFLRFSLFSSLMCFSTFFSYSAFSRSISFVIWAILSTRVSDTFLPTVLYLGSSALLSSSKNFFSSLILVSVFDEAHRDGCLRGRHLD